MAGGAGSNFSSGKPNDSAMPILYKIDATRQRLLTHVAETITVLDIIGHFEEVHREGLLPFAELIDASSILEPTLPVVEVGKAAMAVRNLCCERKFGPRAVWLANDAIFILAHMFAVLMSCYIQMKVFRDRITAEEWLNQQSGTKLSALG
jgi:hypothetical protein